MGRGGGPAGALGARKSQEAWAGDSAVPDWPMATRGQSHPLAWIPYLSLSTKGEGWPQRQQGLSSGVPWLPVLETVEPQDGAGSLVPPWPSAVHCGKVTPGLGGSSGQGRAVRSVSRPQPQPGPPS